MTFTIYDLRFTRLTAMAVSVDAWMRGCVEAVATARCAVRAISFERPFPHRSARSARAVTAQRAVPTPFQRFNISTFQRVKHAFTLIELLVVIAIIAILAAMLLPVFGVAMTHAKKTKARLEVSQIANAVEQYEAQYSRMPVPGYVQQSGSNNVTFGGNYSSASSTGNIYPGTNQNAGWTFYGPGGLATPVGLFITSNSDVMAILLDLTNYPNSASANGSSWTVNTNNQKNPMRTVFLNGSYTGNTLSPGIGTDLNYRDPWGNPYLITMDLNEDEKAEDPFYAPVWMSSSTGAAGGAGVNGLSYQAADKYYSFHGDVMVWSMGPNGPYNQSPSSFTYPWPSGTPPPAAGANTAWAMDPSNKNHILSWAQ